ncbi:ABC transporter permease [Rhizobium leguminosarum]|uniref:ABC transporter permease n=1 Tax=Rhizobium leguminosarum TaxID=384 RepID=UPI001C98AB0F|nr:ABC transporter permease [Rhizobium leguminosarum]MBY5705765.1 ABC transporter permease [Rhizobium leguminosarum]
MTDIAKSKKPERSLSAIVVIGGGIASVLVAAAILAPYVAPYDALKMAAGPRLSAPSASHLFGTDEFGRDLFSRVLLGARLSLGIGIVAVVSGLIVGGLLGLLAAFSGRYIEVLLLRLIDVIYSFPDMLIALVLVAFLGPGIENAMLAIAISFVPFYARVTYALAAGERAKPYVEAAWLAGIRSPRLVRVHVMPNIGQSMIAMATLGFSSAILSAAGLSFLGLGVQPPSPEWGAILASGRNYITKAPWILIFPGLAIFVTVLSFNLIGDGLRDLFDPRRKSH